jgi:hypothetical protein
MPLPGQILIALLVISLLCTYLALRVRDWRFGIAAALLSLPIGVVAQDPYDLLVLPTVQLVATIALRWKAGSLGWLSLALLGGAVWLVGAAGPYLWHWPLAFSFAYLAGFIAGLIALMWRPFPAPHSQRPASPEA